MADEETTNEETETEETETEETSEESGEDNWGKMESLIDRVVEKRLKEWRPAAGTSQKPPQRPAKKTAAPTKGALTEWFRKGLRD